MLHNEELIYKENMLEEKTAEENNSIIEEISKIQQKSDMIREEVDFTNKYSFIQSIRNLRHFLILIISYIQCKIGTLVS